MTIDEELAELRAFKEAHEGKALNRAFARLESLMLSAHDPIMSRRAFFCMADCLVALKEEFVNERKV